jgi:hypothetical protein
MPIKFEDEPSTKGKIKFEDEVQSSVVEPYKAAGKSAFESLGGGAGALGGAQLGFMAGAPLGPVGSLAGGLLGGVGGYYAGEYAQQKAGEAVPQKVKEATGFTPEQRGREKEAYPVASFLGGIAPDVGAALPTLTRMGMSATDLAKSLLGKKTAAQQQALAAQAAEAGKLGKAELSAAQQEQQRLTKLAEAKALEKQTLKAQQQEQATKAGQKAEAKGGRSLRELVGVRTLPELGGYKPIPTTPEKIGEFIRTQADNFLGAIKSQRSKAADVNFTKATIGTKQREARGEFVDTQPLLKEMDALIAKGGTTDYLNSIQRLRNDIAATRGFEGLEVIRRRLGDAAFGVPEEGYKAIGQKFSQKMYDDLAGQMRDFDKSFSKYLDDYKRLSEPIRVYGTKIGKSLTQTEDAAGRYIAKTPEKVAEEVFASPQNFDRFLEAVGGNAEIATAAARRFFAGKLETAKTLDAVEKIVRDNRALLNKPEMKEVAKDIEKYYASLKQSGTRTAGAEKIAGEAAEVQKDIAKQIKDANTLLGDKLKNIEGAEKLFSDAVASLSTAKPGKAIETFETTVLPKIRAAEAKAGVRLLDEGKIESLRQQVQQLEKVYDKTNRERVITGLLATYLIGTEGVSKIKQLASTTGG